MGAKLGASAFLAVGDAPRRQFYHLNVMRIQRVVDPSQGSLGVPFLLNTWGHLVYDDKRRCPHAIVRYQCSQH